MAEHTDKVATAATAHGHEVTITLNKKPVIVVGPRLSGLEIKQAGIDQGLPIELSFTLSEQRGPRWENVGDDTVVTVNRTKVYMATDDDDDS